MIKQAVKLLVETGVTVIVALQLALLVARLRLGIVILKQNVRVLEPNGVEHIAVLAAQFVVLTITGIVILKLTVPK